MLIAAEPGLMIKTTCKYDKQELLFSPLSVLHICKLLYRHTLPTRLFSADNYFILFIKQQLHHFLLTFGCNASVTAVLFVLLHIMYALVSAFKHLPSRPMTVNSEYITLTGPVLYIGA